MENFDPNILHKRADSMVFRCIVGTLLYLSTIVGTGLLAVSSGEATVSWIFMAEMGLLPLFLYLGHRSTNYSSRLHKNAGKYPDSYSISRYPTNNNN